MTKISYLHGLPTDQEQSEQSPGLKIVPVVQTDNFPPPVNVSAIQPVPAEVPVTFEWGPSQLPQEWEPQPTQETTGNNTWLFIAIAAGLFFLK